MLKNSGLLPNIILAFGILGGSLIYKGSSVATWIEVGALASTVSFFALRAEKRVCRVKLKASERPR